MLDTRADRPAKSTLSFNFRSTSARLTMANANNESSGTPGRALLITKRSRTMTRGTCLSCQSLFESRVADTESAEWEIKALFERHNCVKRKDLTRAVPPHLTKFMRLKH